MKIKDGYRPAPKGTPVPKIEKKWETGTKIYYTLDDGTSAISEIEEDGSLFTQVMTVERSTQVKKNTTGKNGYGWQKK